MQKLHRPRDVGMAMVPAGGRDLVATAPAGHPAEFDDEYRTSGGGALAD
jgi:hypothetical protein